MHQQIINEGKSIAIISYFTFIGLLAAYFLNLNKQNPFAAFHIRQSLGLSLIGFIIGAIFNKIDLSFIGNLAAIILLVLWVIALIGAIKGEEKKLPYLGEYFQDWFRNI